jgi:hypothetical protein
LADFAEGRLSAADREQVAGHITGCTRCGEQATALLSVVDLMRTDDSQDAPPHVISRAVRIFRTERLSQATAVRAGGPLRRLVATLRFDSARQAYALGQRAGQTSARELLYEAGDRTIELRLDRAQTGWSVGGQVLGTCAGGEALIERDGFTARTELNELCEFSLPHVGEGIYLLILRLDDVEVEVPGLEFPA